jgi:hypothetical protein
VVSAATLPARSIAIVAPDAPWPLVAVIYRAVALRPEDRWNDAHEMQRALRIAYHETREAPEQTLYLPVPTPEPFHVEETVRLVLPPLLPTRKPPTRKPPKRRHGALVVAALLLGLPFLGPVTGVVHVDDAHAIGVAPAPAVSSEEPRLPPARGADNAPAPDGTARACRGPCTNVPN